MIDRLAPTARFSTSWDVAAGLAESPVWSDDTNCLLWVDGVRKTVGQLNPATGAIVQEGLPGKPGAATPSADGKTLLAIERTVWVRDAAGMLQQLATIDMPGAHFNDGKCDPARRLWIGSRSSDGSLGKGVLYRVDPDGTTVRIATGFDVCNGLGWSPDGSVLYLIDTIPRLLYRFVFDMASGTASDPQVIHDFATSPGKPDGLAVDEHGNVWCAMWDGSGIRVLSPGGRPIAWIDTPCPRPTSCAFGGVDRRSLFVTSALHGLDPDVSDLGRSGHILLFETSVRGAVVGTFGDVPQ